MPKKFGKGAKGETPSGFRSILEFYKPTVSQKSSNHIPSKRPSDDEPARNSEGTQSIRAKSPNLNNGHHPRQASPQVPSSVSSLSSSSDTPPQPTQALQENARLSGPGSSLTTLSDRQISSNIPSNDLPLSSSESDDALSPPPDSPPPPAQASHENISSSNLGSSLTMSSDRRQLGTEPTVDVREQGEESDSDSSLEDLNELLRGGKPTKSSSPLTEPAGSDNEPEFPNASIRKSNSRNTRSTPNSGKIDVLSNLSTRKSTLRNTVKTQSSVQNRVQSDRQRKSLGTLLEQIEKNRAENDAYHRALEVVKQFDAQNTSLSTVDAADKTPEGLTAETLASRIKVDDPEDVDKLVSALNGTEALEIGSKWSFFDRSPLDVEVPKFPDQDGNHYVGCLSRFASQAAHRNALSQEIIDWYIDYSHFEPQDDMFEAHIHAMGRIKFQLSALIDLTRLDVIMANTGASLQVRDVQSKIDLLKSKTHAKSSGPRKDEDRIIKQFLQVIAVLSKTLASKTRAQMLHYLLCMSFDSSLMSNAEILHLQQNAIAACFDSRHPFILTEKAFQSSRGGSIVNRLEPSSSSNVTPLVAERISQEEVSEVLQRIYDKTDSLDLRLQLIKNFPISAPRLVSIRRRLSSAFVYQDNSYLTETAPKFPSLSEVATFLRNQPFFKDRQNVNFLDLGSLISLLDISVDDGDPHQDLHDAEIEKKFNKEVDELSKVIREMTSRIVATGASHTSRTETKEVMAAFESRLNYAVRTKPRPKKSIFGETRNIEGSKLMRKFVTGKVPPMPEN